MGDVTDMESVMQKNILLSHRGLLLGSISVEAPLELQSYVGFIVSVVWIARPVNKTCS